MHLDFDLRLTWKETTTNYPFKLQVTVHGPEVHQSPQKGLNSHTGVKDGCLFLMAARVKGSHSGLSDLHTTMAQVLHQMTQPSYFIQTCARHIKWLGLGKNRTQTFLQAGEKPTIAPPMPWRFLFQLNSESYNNPKAIISKNPCDF